MERMKELMGMYEDGSIFDNNDNVKELLSILMLKVKSSKNEKSRMEELVEILENERFGITQKDILEKMLISKGNFGSILMYIRKKGYEVIKIGDKYIMKKYVKIGD